MAERMNTMDKKRREPQIRLAATAMGFFGALLALGSAILTTPIWGPLLSHENNKPPVARCEADDGSSLLRLQDMCNDIDSRPLAQRAMTAKQYCGVRIVREPLWLHDITEDPDTGVFRLTLSMDVKRHEPSPPCRTVVCAVARTSYPALIGARKGLKFYVSGNILEVRDQQIELTCVSFVFSSHVT
jgi:hypothetical protein